ncbi:hypothetical protein [Escherichia coli]
MKIERPIYGTLPFREKFKMKSEDTLDWYPAQRKRKLTAVCSH